MKASRVEFGVARLCGRGSWQRDVGYVALYRADGPGCALPTSATERRRVGSRSPIYSNSLLQRRGRIADRLRVERELGFRQLQSGGDALRPDGIEPGVQSLRRGKEIDVLADESGIDLGEGVFGAGHVEDGDVRAGLGFRKHAGANVASENRAQQVLLGVVGVDACGQDHVEFDVLRVHGGGRGAAQTLHDLAWPIDAEGGP